MFTISTEAGTVTRRSSSRPPSPARWPDAFLSELEADDSRVRALDASGALAVNSDLLSWFLAVERKCQHLILGQASGVITHVADARWHAAEREFHLLHGRLCSGSAINDLSRMSVIPAVGAAGPGDPTSAKRCSQKGPFAAAHWLLVRYSA